MRTWRVRELLSAAIMVGTALPATVHGQATERYTWRKARIGGGGAIPTVQAHPTVKGALFTTHDVCGPNRWNETTQSFEYALTIFPYNDNTRNRFAAGCEALAFDPTDATGNTVYLTITNTRAFNQEGEFLKSTDRGRTWSFTNFHPIAGSDQFCAAHRIAVDPNNGAVVYYAARDGGVYRSTDAGINFTKLPGAPDGDIVDLDRPKANTGVRCVVVNPYRGTVNGRSKEIYITVARASWVNEMWESTDGGASWHAMNMPASSAKMQVCKDGSLIAACNGTVVRYLNGNWTDLGCPASGIAVDPSNNNRIVAYNSNTWYYSSNGGSTWRNITSAATWTGNPPWYQGTCCAPRGGCDNPIPTSLQFDADGRFWYTDWYQVFRCDNLDATSPAFVSRVAGIEETVVIGHAMASPTSGSAKVYVGVADVGGFGLTDLGTFPSTTCLNPGHNINGIDWAGNVPTMAVFHGTQAWGWDNQGYGGYTDDGGLTYHYFSSRPAGGNFNSGRVAVSADGARILWTNGAGTFSSDDKGDSWDAVNAPGWGYNSIFDGIGQYFVADKRNANRFYLLSGDIMRSDDKGETWHSVSSQDADDLLPNPYVDNDLWVFNSFGLHRSTNAGQSFSAISGVSDVVFASIGRGPSSTQASLYLIGSVSSVAGIWRSDNYGQSWIRLNDETTWPHPTVTTIQGDNQTWKRCYIGTMGGGVYYGDPEVVTGASGNGPSANGRVGISPMHAKPVAIYDLAGRRLASALHIQRAEHSCLRFGVYVASAAPGRSIAFLAGRCPE